MKRRKREEAAKIGARKLVAEALSIEVVFPTLRRVLKVRRGENEIGDKERFKIHVFYMILDSVIEGITERFRILSNIYNKFVFLWTYTTMTDSSLSTASKQLADEYLDDLKAQKLSEEISSLKMIHKQNFGKDALDPLQLLNKIICSLQLNEIFPELVIALKIFLTIPVSAASGERSFSKLSLIENYNRSTMSQDRLNDLSTLNMNYKIARQMDFTDVIKDLLTNKQREMFPFLVQRFYDVNLDNFTCHFLDSF